ncbi:MAG: peptidoglycan DD-metalloendopeptidase family protein [Oscillospiraceae bacterium]|nr:peptidoglycan DD-metalloendopeptidase family protein [Oscillospiraceae bacterium]
MKTIRKSRARIIALALVLISLMLMLPDDTRAPETAAQSATVASQLAALNQRAERLAAANRQREQQMRNLQNDMTRQNEFIALANTQITEIQAQIDAYNELINAKQEAIEETREQIELKEEEIELTQIRIEQRQSQIEVLQEQNRESLHHFGQIAAQMYMDSGGGSLGLFGNSASFADIMLHAEMLRNIGAKNAEFMQELIDAIGQQETAIVALEDDVEEFNRQSEILDAQKLMFEGELKELEATKAAVTAEVHRQYEVLRQLTAAKAEIQQSLNQIQAMSNESEAEMREINRQIERIIREDEERRKRDNNPAPIYSPQGFVWPLESRFTRITSRFGYCSWRKGQHNGVDIASPPNIENAPIYAMQSGTVTHAGPLGTYGNVVFINHGGGYVSIYAHMIRQPAVKEGQTVTQGQHIGNVGSTGRSTGNHLHLEVRRNGSAINPLQFFPSIN